LPLYSVVSTAQTMDTVDDPQRKQALEMYSKFHCKDAAPMLEKLAQKYDRDPVIQEALGACLLANAAGLIDPDQRKKLRVRSYTVLAHAKEIGDNSNLVQSLLLGLPPDGSDTAFSEKQEVEDAMRQGEAAFARSDFDNAIAHYQRALLLEPHQYYAALFIGDSYFAKGIQGSAGE